MNPDRVPRLAGQREITEELGLHPHATWRYLQKPGAPQPVQVLKMGAVYLYADALAWCKAQQKATAAARRKGKS